MARLYPTLLLCLFFAPCVCAQNSSLVYPAFDQYEHFEDAYIAPEGRGYAIGSCNSFYFTTDDGDSWETKDFPPNANQVLDVLCAPGTNCSTVYLISNAGTHRSTDSGNTWALVHNRQMPQMDFSQAGVIYGYRPAALEFYRSGDDGITWTTMATPDQIKDEMHFTSPTVFTMIGDSAFYRSTDSGENWTETYHFGSRTALTTTDDAANYYVETYERDIYKSEDGGFTWTQKAENAHQYTSFHDFFKDAEDSLHVISYNGVRFSSGDDGVTWGRVGNTRFQQYKSFRRGEGRLFASGNGITILKGDEDYTNMTSVFSESYIPFREIVFHDTNTGYAFGQEGEVFRTDNGGETWAMVSKIDTWMQNRPKVAPDGSIYGVQNINDLIRSTDGGETWTDLVAANNALSVSSSRYVFDVLPNGEVVVISNQRAIRLAPDNTVLFDEAGGEASINGGTFDLKMIDANLGFIIRWARLEILRTDDGGRTWTAIPNFGGNNFFNWFEIEDQNTFFIGNGSSSWWTTDAGLNWEEYDNSIALGRFTVNGDLYGFNRSTLARSRNDGANWETMFTTCSQPLDMVRRPGTNEIFLTYENGIERINLDEILSPVRQPQPSAVALRAVPNPTGGMVTVSLPGNYTTRDGTVDLFDLTGRRVNAPVVQNGEELRIDLSRLKPGCYQLRYAAPSGELYQARLIRH